MTIVRQSFPKSIADVSLTWLNAVLPCAARVQSFKASALAEQGVTSKVYLLDLVYETPASGATEQLLLKIASDNPDVREALREGRGYLREVAFYERLGADAGIAIPRCFALGYDERDNSFLLLLEYVGNSSVRDIVAGSVADIGESVAALARFHVRWWGRDGELNWVERDTSTALLDLRVQRVTTALETIRRDYAERIDAPVLELLELYREHSHLLASDAASGPLTLCHGDFHRKQLLFPDNTAGRFCVLDWQTVTLGRGADDLARIIVTGLRNDDRLRHEGSLVRGYHELLLAHGIDDYPLAQLWQHYYLGVARLLMTHCMVFTGFDLQPLITEWRDKGLDWFEVFFHWPCVALEEHDVLNRIRRQVAGSRPPKAGLCATSNAGDTP